jgi:hypothetical protein
VSKNQKQILKKRRKEGQEQWLVPVIPTSWEAEIERIVVPYWPTSPPTPSKKVIETPISIHKVSMVVCNCSPSFLEGHNLHGLRLALAKS